MASPKQCYDRLLRSFVPHGVLADRDGMYYRRHECETKLNLETCILYATCGVPTVLGENTVASELGTENT